MRLSFDRDADALTIVFKKERVIKDKMIDDRVFAGYSQGGDLVEIQVLDISEDDDTWLTVELAAKLLEKSERTILRWISQGKIPAKKYGKEYKIKPDFLEDLSS